MILSSSPKRFKEPTITVNHFKFENAESLPTHLIETVRAGIVRRVHTVLSTPRGIGGGGKKIYKNRCMK
jgi:hypothetical protein